MPEVVRTKERVGLMKQPSPDMEVYSMYREAEPVGSIVFVARDHINAATVTSLMMSDLSWLPKGRSVDTNIIQGSILTTQRNASVQRMRGDWLMFIDDDMVWQTDAIAKLVEAREEHDLDMLGGLCFQRGEPHQPTMYMREAPTEGYYNFLEDWEDGEIKEVDATGCAFLIIHKRVFEMIAGGPMPPYEDRIKDGGPPPNFFRWEGTLGEDLRFCQDAKAAGARIWVHTGVSVDHVTEVKVGYKDFLMQIRQRDQATYKARREINDRMGLPTISPAEAKRRLGW